MDELVEQHREQALDAGRKQEQHDLRIAEVDGLSDSDREAIQESMRKRAESGQTRLAEQWATQMVWRERDLSLTHTGPPEQIVNEMDPAFVERLSIHAPQSAYLPVQATVHLSRGEGCSIELRGEDPSWLRMARDTLSNEMQHGVPYWAWLRTPQPAVAYTGVLLIALAMAAWDTVTIRNDKGEPDLASKLGLAILVAPLAGILIATGLQPLVRRLLLGLEIIPPGVTPKSGRAIGIVASVVVSFILGIVVNLITK